MCFFFLKCEACDTATIISEGVKKGNYRVAPADKMHALPLEATAQNVLVAPHSCR